MFRYKRSVATMCEGNRAPETEEVEPPPQVNRVETMDQKAFRKFTEQPLIPIGCVATVYFLGSGIKAFRNRDPVRSQKMMKGRVMAQFLTLACFVGYVGLDNFDFRLAPMYQDVKKVDAYYEEEASSDKGTK